MARVNHVVDGEAVEGWSLNLVPPRPSKFSLPTAADSRSFDILAHPTDANVSAAVTASGHLAYNFPKA